MESRYSKRQNLFRTFAVFLCLALTLGCLTPLAGAAGGTAVEAVVTPVSVKAGSTYQDPSVTVDALIDTVGLTNGANPAEATYEFVSSHCWHTDVDPGENAWVLVDLGAAVDLENLYIWNLSENVGDLWNYPDRDVRDIQITYSGDSTDGSNGNWNVLGEKHTVAQAVQGAEKANLVVPFDQTARFVRIQMLNSYGGSYWGLGKLLFTTDISGDPVAVARRDLQAVCDRAAGLQEGNYTASSWAAVKVALYQAQKLLEESSEDAEAMTAAAETLENALENLQEQTNVAGTATVTASEYYHDNTYNLAPENAVDGDLETWWASNNGCVSATYTFTFADNVTVNTLSFFEYGSYNNVKDVTVRYGAERTAVTGATAPAYSGQQRTMTFDEITANVIELTLTTNNAQEGLNIAEFQLSVTEPVQEVAVDATNSGAAPAGNLVDGSSETFWVSDGASNTAEITIDYGVDQIVNTFTVEEAEDAEGTLTKVQVDVEENNAWKNLVEVDAAKQWRKKNLFLSEPVIGQKFRITLTTDGGVMKIAEISQKLSSEDEMPVDSDLITLQPDVKPNEYQQQMVDRAYTMFIHFGINTFGESEWTYGDVDPSVYAPAQIDADQWVKVAKEAGMETVLLVTKHHDGFCLWDSEYTDYDVGNEKSGSHVDVLQAVSDACNKYGVNMGVYYSAWDNNWDKRNGKENDAAYNEYMRNQLTEIMSGKYGLKDENGRGVITELWIDGAWEKAPARWEFDRMYDTVKTLQPSCQVGINHTMGIGYSPLNQQEGDEIYFFPSDFRLLDPHDTREGADADPKIFAYRGQYYYLPFEATWCLNSSWFYHTGYGTGPSMDPGKIAEKYQKYQEQGNVLVLNCGPNRDGRIEQADIESLYAAARKLNIASGDALKPSVTEWVDSLYGENLALGATGTSEQSYIGDPQAPAEDYTPDKLFDGNRGTRWATNEGHENCVVEFTLTKEETFNTIIAQENAQYGGRTDKATLEYWDGSTWQPLGEAMFQSGEATFVLEPSITAQKLRMTVHSPDQSGPTLDEIVVSYVAQLPEIAASVDSNPILPGETAAISVESAATVGGDVQMIDLRSLCTFSSSNPDVAAVNGEGVVTAVAPGSVVITVRLEVLGRVVEKEIPMQVSSTAVVPSDSSYIVKAEQSEGGTISPASRVVSRGGKVTFTITAKEGYRIADVLVDGKSVGAVSTYTFENVKANHTISAKFEKIEEITTVGGFTDVKSSDWFAEAVQYAVDEGLMNGTSETSFSPKGATTRGMIVTILYRQAGSPVVESDGKTWWSDARMWAMENGVSDGTNMDKEITREQLATMLYRYAALQGKDVSKTSDLDDFHDASKVSSYAVEALEWAAAEGIVTGKTGGVMDPQAGATRAETATMLMRFCML